MNNETLRDPLTRLADQIDSQAAISNRASQMHILESIAAQLRTERNRLHSWAGLMSLLDEHYPADIFTGESKDIGPQILALIREINQLRTHGHVMNETPRESLEHAARLRAATPGRPEDGPYPATVGEVADEVVQWIKETDTKYARGLTRHVIDRLQQS
jgi:hypothetical protein